MKEMLGVSILVLLTIILSFAGYNLIKYYTESLAADLKELETAVENNDWSKADLIDKKISGKWEKTNNFLPVVIDHSELHDLEMLIDKISFLIRKKKTEDLLTEITTTKKLLKHIPLQEKLTIRNIL